MLPGQESRWGYMVMWEFVAKPGMEARFEQIYGPSGDWARLFQRNENYLGTELKHEEANSRRYATRDFWTSEEAYERFREKHRIEYQAIDQQCEQVRESERKLAEFTRVV